MKENERLKELGRPQLQMAPPYKVDKREIQAKLRQFEQIFLKSRYDKKEQEIHAAGYGDEPIGSQKMGHDPNHPMCWQQLNISINNYAM